MYTKEEEIVLRVTNGEYHLFEEIVNNYQNRVYTICLGILQNREDAEDAAQEVFINIYTSLHKFKGTSAFSTWIYRIAVNCSLEYLRKKKRSPQNNKIVNNGDDFDQLRTNGSIDSPDKEAIRREEEQLLAKAISSLPEKQKIAIVLTKYRQLSQKEAAKVMKMGEKALESLITRAKNNLKKYIESK